LRDGNPENDPRVYLTSGILRALPDKKTQVYPGWYYISTLVKHLGRYQPYRVIREDGGVWIYQYRHRDFHDSLACFIYKPTVNGSSIKDFSWAIGNTVNNQVSKVGFSDNSEQGLTEIMKIQDGKVSIEVLEKPTLYLYKQPNSEK
jgi:hypothetical protein